MNFFNLVKLKNIKIILPVLFIGVVLVTIFSYYIEYSNVSTEQFEIMKKEMPELGLNLYYTIQDAGLTLVYFVLMITFSPNIFASHCLEIRNSKYLQMIMTRIGYVNAIKGEICATFLISMFINIIANILILFVIHLFLLPIHFGTVEVVEGVYDLSILFSNNQLISIFIYILFSSIGYGVFTCFIYSLQTYVRNIYLFRSLGLILGILLVIFPSFISQIINVPILSTMLYFFSVWAMLTPGIGIIIPFSPFIVFIGSIAMYSIVILVLLEIRKRKFELYGD